MVVTISQQTAVQLGKVQEFEAPDPWTGMQPALWTLSVYRVIAGNDRNLFAQFAAEQQSKIVDGKNLDPDDTLGIRAGAHSPFHLLPRAMVRLWQQGRVPTQDLPRLVAAMEPKLKRNPYAYFSPGAGRAWMRPFGWVCLLGGLLAVFAGLFNNYVRHVEDSGLVAGLILLGVIFLACAASFLLLGRAGSGGSRRHEQQILDLLASR